MSKPKLFVDPVPELPLALLDQKEAGKRLLLITNSDYHYTDKMMKHSFNKFLPNVMDWRDLFDMVIVSARKPEFIQMSHPLYEVVTGEGLMRPCFKVCTQMVEISPNVRGDEILYVDDHIYTDVSGSKVHLRWRTALICRELEEECTALICSRGHREELIELQNRKEVVGDLFNQIRLALQRRSKGRPAQTLAATNLDDQELTETTQKLLIVIQRLDDKICLMLESDGELFNKRFLLKRGNLPTFRRRLAAGTMYSISGFDVAKRAQNVRLSVSSFLIRFTDTTSFEKLIEPVSPLPQEGFRFRNQTELVGLANTNTQFPDIIGEITAVKTTVTEPPEDKNRVMATVKLEGHWLMILRFLM
ncbi:uncharacterized protein LOC108837924 isoform X2 [Raphanus sativus]|uniref:Uncharacterized protein LOC108837924 isoform X2 n=1 Tax=Raphanus sativus TaxID=3726 RepID=A0A9W3BQT2_RAPSA|nr:uncharacterized protein LOC108837924 isoform X2 [Raphanus sativus]